MRGAAPSKENAEMMRRANGLMGLLMVGAMTLTVLGATPAIAAPQGGGWGGGGGRGMHAGAQHDVMPERFMKQLNLTPEQRGKIETIRAKAQEQHRAQREQLMTRRQELHQLVRSASATRDQALAKQREVNALQNQLAEARIATWFEMRGVLTPEQLKQLESMKTQKPRRMKRQGPAAQ